MSCEVVALLFKANSNYGTWSIDLGKSLFSLHSIDAKEYILLPPKYEIIMLPSNHSFFQYCNSNIGLFSIAPCKVLASFLVSILCFF